MLLQSEQGQLHGKEGASSSMAMGVQGGGVHPHATKIRHHMPFQNTPQGFFPNRNHKTFCFELFLNQVFLQFSLFLYFRTIFI